MNNKFETEFHKFDEEAKKSIPVIYNFIYRFNKRGHVKKKGNSYYGVSAEVLATPTFFPWGHNKPISKMVDYSKMSVKKDKDEHSDGE